MKRKGNSTSKAGELKGERPDVDLDFLRVPATISKEEAWLQLMARLSKNRVVSKIPITHTVPFRVLAVAATITILVISYYFMALSGWTTLATGNGQMATAYLPDSSVVTLNSGTTIRFNVKQWNKNRKVKLDGEAFFLVKKGSRFSVITSKSVTSVVGTSFNVYARGAEVRISCIAGKVLVMSKYSGESKLLLPGYKTKVTENTRVEVKRTNIDREAKWIDGNFYFQQEPIERVLEEMERQYNIKIVYAGSVNRTYTGFFTNKDISEALNLVCIPMRLNYRKIDANTIQVY